MKKALSLFLSIALLFTSVGVMPLEAFAANEQQNAAKEWVAFSEELNSKSKENDEPFLPIIIEGDNATQGDTAIDTLTENDNTLISVDDMELPEEIKEDIVTESKNNEDFAAIEDVADAINAQVDSKGDVTALVKPFQTKRLTVYSSYVPNTGETERVDSPDGAAVLIYNSEEATEKAYNLLVSDTRVKKVFGDNVYKSSELTEDDFRSNDQKSWGASYVKSYISSEYIMSKSITTEVVVGIVDTGISLNHSFLKERISDKSKSFVKDEATVDDYDGHGSHVAGIIRDNTPDNVKLLAAKGLDKDGYGDDYELANAIRYCVDEGATVINMSWGGYSYWTESVLKNAISYAYNKGVTLCAAAGNEDDDTRYYYPANSTYCITVAATNQFGSPAYFSNYGNAVDIAAPGTNIRSSVKSGFLTYSGTSMATPFICAAAAVDIIVNGHKTPSTVKNALKEAVTPITNKSNRNYGTGIISFTKLLNKEITAPAIFSVKNGYYRDEFYLGINCSSPYAKIIYTTDGSVPTLTNGTEYTSPILVSENIIIKARAFENGKLPSVITRANYYFNTLENEDNFTIENGVITSYIGSMTALIVPDVIQGQTVIGVGANVFKSKNVMSVQLPDTVTFIGNSAFYGCLYLQSVIARGATIIDENAFYLSVKSSDVLEYVEFSPLQSVGKAAFYNRHYINEDLLDISNLTEIPQQAFYGCGFTHLAGEENLTSVSEYGFYENNIVSLNAPELTEVGQYAFAKNKLSVINADNLKTAGQYAFSENKELKSISFPNLGDIGTAVFKDCGIEKASLPAIQKVGSNIFMNCVKLIEYNGPDMNYVPQGFFNGCSSLKEIPECFKYATNINGEAFKNCSSFETLDLSYATNLGKDAISGCNNVRTLNIDNVTLFNQQSGFNSPYITTLVLPEVVKFYGFTDNDYVKEIRLPKAVSGTSLEMLYVRNCTALETFYAPYLTELTNNGMFGNCPKLKKLVIYSTTKLDYNVFTANNWSNYINPEAIEEIITPKATINGYRPLRNLKLIDVSAAKTFSRFNQSSSFTIYDESLEHIIAPNVETGTFGYIPDSAPIKELNLPSLKELSIKGPFYTNVHMPNATSLETRDFTGGTLVLPKAINEVTLSYDNSTVYSTNDELTIKYLREATSFNRITEPAFIENLSESVTLSQNNPSIEVHVMAPDPVYSWYYSEDGNDYEELTSAGRYNLLPEKSGYYYCSVYDRESEKTLVSDICSVNCPYETVSVDFGFETAVNAFVGETLVEGITNETISVPKDTSIRVLYNGVDDNILFEGEQYYIYESMDNGFVLNVTKNSTVVPAEHTETLIDIGKCEFTFSSLNYNGKPQTPDITVSYEGETLTEGVDYEIPVMNPGISSRYFLDYDYEYHYLYHSAVFRGIGRFTGTAQKVYTIDPTSINDCTIEVEPEMVYSGIAQKPQVHVFIDGYEVSAYDYNIKYSNNINIGTGRVTITGDDNLTGSKTLTFEIVPKLDSFRVIVPDCAFTGEQIKPQILVNNKYIALTENEDYTVEYGENINKGVGTYTIKGINRFEGQEINGTFNIGTSLTGAAIQTEFDSYEFTGEKIEPKVTVTFENNVLEQGKDYTVSYNSNTNIGKGRITVTGTGEYIGSVYGYFDIVSKPAEEHHHSPSEAKKENIRPSTCTVNGSYDEVVYCSVCGVEIIRETKTLELIAHTPVIDKAIAHTCTVTGLTQGSHCSVCGKILTAQETIKATGHMVVADAAVPATFTATGKTAGSHCSVCGAVITARQTVAKLGAAKLSKVKAAKKKFIAIWATVANVDGYEIQYCTSKKFKKKAKGKKQVLKKVTVKKQTVKKKTVKKLKSKKTYYVRIRAYKVINGKKVYSKWSAKKKVKIK